jgi:predicted  nucleic acid-binding Zn-ribbon protein
MSIDNLPNRLTSVEKLVQRLKSAELSNQKEIRMSVQEAKEIITDLSILTSKMANHVQEINERLKKLESNQGVVEVKMDGGTF